MKNRSYLKERLIRILRLPAAPAIISAITALILITGSLFVFRANHRAAVQQERLTALGNLEIMKSRLEEQLNSRLQLGRGLVSFLSIKPGLTMGEFIAYSSKLLDSDRVIRNISVIRMTTITYAYPFETNRAAIGVDLAKIPEQRDSVLRVIDTGKTSVTANVRLVQGGTATVCRIPVYTGAQNRYWGQISIVLMQDALISEAGIFVSSHGLNILLTAYDEKGSESGILYGDKSIAGKDPVLLDVKFPHGTWKLAAIPDQGWGFSDRSSPWYALAGIILSLITGLLIFTIMKLGQRVEQLESILPICSHCKKIRNDSGYWDSVDSFFSRNSSFRFSHGICPDCAEKIYGDQPWYRDRDEKE